MMKFVKRLMQVNPVNLFQLEVELIDVNGGKVYETIDLGIAVYNTTKPIEYFTMRLENKDYNESDWEGYVPRDKTFSYMYVDRIALFWYNSLGQKYRIDYE